MHSSFKLVSNMNIAFGNPKGEAHVFVDMSNPAWDKLRSQCKNIQAEFFELMTAIDKGDIEEVRDALCDIQVFAMGGQHLLGVDGDADMVAVVGAVMTRFCVDQEQLDATVKKYQDLGIDVYTEGNFPTMCVKSASDQLMPEYPKGKFLKSVGYSKPVFPLIATTVPDQMAEERAKHMRSEADIKEMIDRATTMFRASLEKQLQGLPAYDSSKNNTPDDVLSPPTN